MRVANAADLEELVEFERIEPFGWLSEERRAARLRAQIWNMMGSKNDIPMTELDFCPDHPALDQSRKQRKKELTTPRQTKSQMRDVLLKIAGPSKTDKKKGDAQ